MGSDRTESSFDIISEVDDSLPKPNLISAEAKDEMAEYAKSDAKRANREKNTFHYIKLIAIYVIAIAVGAIFLIRVAHFVLPTNCQWITNTNLQAIDKYFFSGAIGGALAKYGGNIFKEK